MTSADGKQIGGDHYARMTVQPWDAMEAWMPREQFCGYLLCSAIAYLARSSTAGLSGERGGRRDIEKAAHCLEKLLELHLALEVAKRTPESET